MSEEKIGKKPINWKLKGLIGWLVLSIVFNFAIVFCMDYYGLGDTNYNVEIVEYNNSSIINETTVDQSNLSYMDMLALQLNENGWILYHTENCPPCYAQIEYFDTSIKYVNHYECFSERPSFIEKFPTWFNYKTGEVKVGFKNETELREMM